MFTFAVMTYNQEKYIIEHLESIKYQINTFGKGNNYKLLICDDFSSDNTVFFINKWLNMNENLFSEVEIRVNKFNMGISKNYVNMLKQINTKEFKTLAGDDLYYKNNIFDIDFSYDFICTPILEFNKNTVYKQTPTSFFLVLRANNFFKIKKYLKYGDILLAPGIFLNYEIIKDKNLLEYILKGNWIEDVPQWEYLFFLKNRELNIKVMKIPYILYRWSIGISNNANHEKNENFIAELNSLKKDKNLIIGSKTKKKYKYLNPYKYYWKLLNLKVKYIDSYINKDIRDFINYMRGEFIEAQEYLDLIQNRAKDFYNKIGVNFDE